MEDLPMEFKDTYINDLYSGQISYMENLCIESKEYKEKKAILKSLYNELEETLSEKEFKKIVQIYETGLPPLFGPKRKLVYSKF